MHTTVQACKLTGIVIVPCLSMQSEDAEDRGADDPAQRTLGVVSSELAIGQGSARVVVQDHGGMAMFRGTSAFDAGLSCPTSVYVVVMSLTADKLEQRRQIKYW